MSELSDKQARLAALRKARDTGVLIVKHGETSTTYRSMAEMREIIADLEREIGVLDGKRPTRVKYGYQAGKGL